MYPTKQEFQHLLRTHPADWIINNHLFQGVPFYCLEQPAIHEEMVRAISAGLRVRESGICVVGSARIGFSLAPKRFGEPFSRFSDIDVIVVSPRLFDRSWIDLLNKSRRRRVPLRWQTRESLKRHRQNHYVYNGWLYPDSVLEVLRIGTRWLHTFDGLSRIEELASRKVGARLYRTWDHARFYHRHSLGRLKEEISV